MEELDQAVRIRPICGYQGHLHGFTDTFSKSFQPSVDIAELNSTLPHKRIEAEERLKNVAPLHRQGITADRKQGAVDDSMQEQSALGSMFVNFRRAHEGLSIRERYDLALRDMSSRGQEVSVEHLQLIVRAKIQERCHTYADQAIKVRNMFNYFDLDGSGSIDEDEFRQCLEMLNCQLTDEQALALFAHLDNDCSGSIEWAEFSQKIMVHNPAGPLVL